MDTMNYSDISLSEVKDILSIKLTKNELAELGYQRFGISKSLIKGMNKANAIFNIEAALDNERTLDVISRLAKEAGRKKERIIMETKPYIVEDVNHGGFGTLSEK